MASKKGKSNLGTWEKVGLTFVDMLLPASLGKTLRIKCKMTKQAFTSNRVLRCFWILVGIALSPVFLAFSLVAAILKTIVIWILPEEKFVQFRYLFNQFFRDVTKEHLSIKVAIKRISLCYELFTKGAERQVSFGEKNPDKTFYVLRPYYYLQRNELTQNVSNLLTHYYRTLQNLAYAIENHWIPVVDWENYGPFPHQEDYAVHGTRNCWEYYWNQPSEYTLEEVYQSKNVILSTQNTRDNEFVPSGFFSQELQQQAEDYATRCPKYDRYFTLHPVVAQYIQEKEDQLFPKGARILGVAVRGTSYGMESTYKGKAKADGHPRQPTEDKLIRAIRDIMAEWNMEYVFITCEYAPLIERIHNVLGDKVIYLPRKRYVTPPKRGDVEKKLDPLYVPGQKYQTNLDYLTEMVLLSRCNSLLAAMSSGTRAAIIWNAGKYEHMQIIENGLW